MLSFDTHIFYKNQLVRHKAYTAIYFTYLYILLITFV